MSDINDLAAMTAQFGAGEEVAPAEVAPADNMMDAGFLSSPEAFEGPDYSAPAPDKEVAQDPVVEQAPALPPEKKEYGSYQEYVGAGNDPDLYQGPKAREKWNDLKEREKQVKDERNQTNTMLTDMQAAMQRQEQRAEDEQSRQKIYYEEQMKKADDEDDLEQYKLASRQHAAIPDPKPINASSTEPPEVQQLRRSDPRLDHWSPSFDPEFNQRFEGQVNYLASDLKARNNGRELSSFERQHVIDTAKGQLLGNAQQPAPNPNRQRPAPVKTPSVSSAKSTDPVSKMSPETKTMYNEWSKGTPHQQNYAKTLLESYK